VAWTRTVAACSGLGALIVELGLGGVMEIQHALLTKK